MVFETRKQALAWMDTDYSKHTHFRRKIKWRLEHLVALEIMGEAAPLGNPCTSYIIYYQDAKQSFAEVK